MDTNINNAAEDILRFQINRSLKNQSKMFLVMLEDLLEISMNFSYNQKRKIILDNMNNSIRELDALIDRLDVNLKK